MLNTLIPQQLLGSSLLYVGLLSWDHTPTPAIILGSVFLFLIILVLVSDRWSLTRLVMTFPVWRDFTWILVVIISVCYFWWMAVRWWYCRWWQPDNRINYWHTQSTTTCVLTLLHTELVQMFTIYNQPTQFLWLLPYISLSLEPLLTGDILSLHARCQVLTIHQLSTFIVNSKTV